MKHITCIEDLRRLHMRRVPKAFFDYADRGSYTEDTLRANSAKLQEIKFRQRILVDVSKRDLSTTILGEPAAMPLILAPVSVKRTPGVNADLAGDDAVGELLGHDMRFTAAISVLGLPSAVAPVGLVDGHPVGVQLIASRYREDICLDAAAAIEARVGVLTHQLWDREISAG